MATTLPYKFWQFFRTVGRSIFGVLTFLLALFFAVVVIIQFPKTQNWLAQKAAAYYQKQTQRNLTVSNLYLNYDGSLSLKKLFVEDVARDTLIYSESLQLKIRVLPLFFNKIHVNYIAWEGVRGKIQLDENNVFNFQYILDAFAQSNESSSQEDTLSSDSEWLFQLDHLTFRDFDLRYEANAQEQRSQVTFERLEITPNLIDLINQNIDIQTIHLSSATILHHQFIENRKEEAIDSAQASFPMLSLENLLLENIVYDIVLPNSQLDAKGVFGELSFSLPEGKTNLNERQLETGPIHFRNLIADVIYSPSIPEQQTQNEVATTPFDWPDWQVAVPTFVLEGGNFSFVEKGASHTLGSFNPKAIGLEDMAIALQEVTLDNSLNARLSQLSFSETSGFAVNQLTADLQIESKTTKVTFALQTPNNEWEFSGKSNYQNLDSLFSMATTNDWEVDIKLPRVGVRDAFFFAPEMRKDSIYQQLAEQNLRLSLSANGNKNKWELRNAAIYFGEFTQCIANGVITNPFDKALTAVEALSVKVSSSKKDFSTFLNGEDYPLPDTVFLSGFAKGNLENIAGKAMMHTNLGDAGLEANVNAAKAVPEYGITMQLYAIQLVSILNDKRFGDLSMTIDVEGKGIDAATVFANYNLEVSSLWFDGYHYENFKLNGTAANRQFNTTFEFEDKNLSFKMDSRVLSLEQGIQGDFQLDLGGANFTGLQLAAEDLRAGGILTGRFLFDDTQQELELRALNFKIIKSREVFPLSNVLLYAFSDTSGSSLKINSEILNLEGNSNMTFDQMPTVLRDHFLSYYDVDEMDSTAESYYLNVDGEIKNSRFLSEVVVPGLTELEPGEIHIHYSTREDVFDANVQLPLINFKGTRIKNLTLSLDSKGDSLSASLHFDQIASGPLLIPFTNIVADVKKDEIRMQLEVLDNEAVKMLYLATYLTNADDTQFVKVDPNLLILNYNEWTVNPQNTFWYTDHHFGSKNAMFSNANQSIVLKDGASETTDLNIDFSNFSLASITKILNPDEAVFDGILNGDLNLNKRTGRLAFLADLTISDIKVLDVPTGDLYLKLDNLTKDSYRVDLGLEGEGLELNLEGQYQVSQTNPRFDLELEIKRAEMRVLESFTDNVISDATGYMWGNVKLGGLLSTWDYSGELAFENAGFLLRELNTRFDLSDERIVVKDESVLFSNFTLRDANRNTSRLSGTIGLSNPANPDFAMRIQSSNFLFLNSTREQSDLFFGKLLVDMDIQLSGTALQPEINATTRLNKGTNLTFIVPESEMAEIEREGVVLFTNVKDPEDPFTTYRGKEAAAQVFGVDLKALIEVDKSTTFRVIMDERSGDYLSVAGGANLIFDLTPAGRMSLSGQYEVNEGKYELSFYDLVRRRFDFRKGSTITWSGDPLAGTLDLSAIYTIRTSAKDLMAAQITGADAATQNRYRQELPFEVFLNINGEMLKPEVGFVLDMPQNSRGELGGNVYATILQLNENESELNKQVFALLVLGGFIPEMGGSVGGASTAVVRSSVSQLLSDQLNTLSGKYIKGVDIDLGLNSYTDYRSGDGQDRTQLNVNVSKQLLDDRLIVSVGSNLDLEGNRAQQQHASDIIGNISVEYMLTEDGRFRFKAFRRNQFEGVFDGHIITTGVSLRYAREFNRFKQIWRSQREEEGQEEPNQKTPENVQ